MEQNSNIPIYFSFSEDKLNKDIESFVEQMRQNGIPIEKPIECGSACSDQINQIEPINPNHPVYISYSWNRKGIARYEHLEDDVNRVCELMKQNGIVYKRDKDGLCPLRADISNVADIIGNGDIVICFISEKYLKSFFTMYEWHCIIKKGKPSLRIFLICLEEDKIITSEKLEEIRKKNYNKLKNKKPYLNVFEKEAFETEWFKNDIVFLYNYASKTNLGGGIEVFRKTEFSEFINTLCQRVKEVVKVNKVAEENDCIKNEINILNEEINNLNNEISSMKVNNQKVLQIITDVKDDITIIKEECLINYIIKKLKDIETLIQ
ncbi:MAG: toll/interleukin-1 receptor domain-containing protein [Bacteroidales bacterium]|nr:toll/interleukin-1 receptor domain-containing protein [Bacteroidales bacterium]